MNKRIVFNVVRAMNWKFGRGDLLRLEWTSRSGGCAVVKPFQLREERFRFELRPNDKGKVFIHYRNRKRLCRGELQWPSRRNF